MTAARATCLCAGVVTYTALRSFLLERADEQLDVTAQAVYDDFRDAGGATTNGVTTAYPHGTVAELRSGDRAVQ